MTRHTLVTPFGILLKEWRGTREISQLELAALASSTPRHISFLETGRSRPRSSMVSRIGRALALPPREHNELLRSAGLPPEFSEHELGHDDLHPYQVAIDALLVSHEPFPACVINRWGRVVQANQAFDALSPGASEMEPEELVAATFGTEEGRDLVLNWEELAWAYVDRMSAVARKTSDDRLGRLVDQVRGYLADSQRPDAHADSHLLVKLAVGELKLTTFTTFVRFENARDVTLSELTVELVFPADDPTRRFFEGS